MSLLPAKNVLDGSKTPATTTSEMKSAMGTLRDFLAGLLGGDSGDKAAARKQLGAAPVVPNILAKSVAGDANVTLTDDDALNDIFNFTGALTANIEVSVPNSAKEWIVQNKTTGTFTLTLKTAAGAGVVVGQGKNQTVFCDGTDVLTGMNDFVVPSSTPEVRQTVLGGVTNASGYANMLSAGTGLSLNLAATGMPMRTAFAQGALDFITTLSADTPGVVTGLSASNLSFIYQDYVSPTSVTWGSTLAPRQEGNTYNQAAQSVLQFGGAAGSTTFLDDFGNIWTAQGGSKVQSTQKKFGTGSLGGSGTANAMNGTTDYIKSTAYTTLGNGGWSLRAWIYNTAWSASENALVHAGNAAGYGAALGLSSAGKTLISLSSTGTSWDLAVGTLGAATVALNTWAFLELTYDPVFGKYFVYVNGALDQTVTSANKICAITGVFVGALTSLNAGYFMRGYIDKFEFAPYCEHPNGVSYTPPIAAPNVATQGYASDFWSEPNQAMYQVSGPSVAAGTNPTFTAKNRVYVGEATAGAGAISSVVNYALRNKFISLYVNPAGVSSRTLKAHNIGSDRVKVTLNLVNIAPEFGYTFGQKIPYMTLYNNGSYAFMINPLQILDRNTIGIASNNYAAIGGQSPGNAPTSYSLLTTVNWLVELIVEKA